jgi:hypothetical protein
VTLTPSAGHSNHEQPRVDRATDETNDGRDQPVEAAPHLQNEGETCHADERSERTRVNCQHLAEVDAQLQRWGVQCGDELVRALMRDLGHNEDSRVK